MQRVKTIFSLTHVIVWVLFIMLLSLQLSTDRHPHGTAMVIALSAACLYIFYSHFFLLTRYSGKSNRTTYFSCLALIVVTGPLPMFFLYLVTLNSWDVMAESYRINLVSTVPIFLFLSWLARVTENLVLNTIRKEQLEKQAVEAELYYLKSQINPHFLFNTLNNIHTLVYKQAATAPEAVMQLASLMRYMIYESNAATVPLSRELEYLQDYVSLQQLRYKQSPVLELEVQGDISSCHIAPLLFIHLLENAYK